MNFISEMWDTCTACVELCLLFLYCTMNSFLTLTLFWLQIPWFMNFVFVPCDVPLHLESSTCLFLFHLSLEFMVYRALCWKRVSCTIGKISSRAHSPYQCSFCNFFQGMLIVEKILIQSGKKIFRRAMKKRNILKTLPYLQS